MVVMNIFKADQDLFVSEHWNVVSHNIDKLNRQWFDPKQNQWNKHALDILAKYIGIRVLKWDKALPSQPVEVEIIDMKKFKEAYEAYKVYLDETIPTLPQKGI